MDSESSSYGGENNHGIDLSSPRPNDSDKRGGNHADKTITNNEATAKGTVRPMEPFDVEIDCRRLRDAMSGLGTDEAAIIDVIGRRSNNQRQHIKARFAELYGKVCSYDLFCKNQQLYYVNPLNKKLLI